MKNQKQRTQQAEAAIKMLKYAISINGSQTLASVKGAIIEAYDYLENDDSFSWDNLDCLYLEWDELVDQANEIIYV